MTELIEMTSEQRRIFIDTEQLYSAYRSAVDAASAYKGGMHWKKAKGKEYLFKSMDRFGNGRSLGPRSPTTEEIFSSFQAGKQKANDRLRHLKQRLNDQARYVKAARIQRVPATLARILRVLDRENLLGKQIKVIGTNALYAYESLAGVFFKRSMTATQDADILWDIRPKLTLVTDQANNRLGFLNLIQKADNSFEPLLPGGYRATNKDGYIVDLIKAEPRPPSKVEKTRMGGEDDLSATEIRNLQWLLSSPTIKQTVLGEDGQPAIMAVPDPRSYAIHKMWLSRQFDRNPLKKHRDEEQAIVVVRLISRYLPQYQLNPTDLKMFPKSVVAECLHRIGSE